MCVATVETVETKPVAVVGGGDKAGAIQVVMEWRVAEVAPVACTQPHSGDKVYPHRLPFPRPRHRPTVNPDQPHYSRVVQVE